MRLGLFIVPPGYNILYGVVCHDFPHCSSLGEVVAPGMAGPLSPWLPTLPWCCFWSAPADPEGLLLRASSEAATPHTDRDFSVPAG